MEPNALINLQKGNEMALYPFYPPTISSASVGAVKSVRWLGHASPVHSIMSVRPQRNKPSRSWVELWVYSTVRILSSTPCSGRGMCSSYGEAGRGLEDSPCWVVLGAAQNPPPPPSPQQHTAVH